MEHIADTESEQTRKLSIQVEVERKEQVKDFFENFKVYFPDHLPARLPPLRAVNHEIDLDLGSSPPSRPAYRMSKPEVEELERQLGELLKNEFIQPSKSPYGAPVFFIGRTVVFDWCVTGDSSTRSLLRTRYAFLMSRICLMWCKEVPSFQNWILRQDIIKSEFEKRIFIKRQSILH